VEGEEDLDEELFVFDDERGGIYGPVGREGETEERPSENLENPEVRRDGQEH